MIAINVAPSVRIVALAQAVAAIGYELASIDGRIAMRPGRPRLIHGSTRRRASR